VESGKGSLHYQDSVIIESGGNGREARQCGGVRFTLGDGATIFECRIYTDFPENGGVLKEIRYPKGCQANHKE